VSAGAVRYNVYKLMNGLYGYIGQSAVATFVDDNITADTSRTPAIANDPFSGASNYPGAVGYFESRRVFGGTDNKPQTLWMTRSATESNLSYSIPTRADDSITLAIKARDVNRIRHIVPITHLIMLTSGGEWKIAPQNSDILTPESASPRQETNEGASNVTPVITSSSVLYTQAGAGRVRELKYRWEQSGYQSSDISIMAPHLFNGYTIADMAFVKSPSRMVFAVRSDGTLLGLTYLPEHEVVAWHTHSTDGVFESVASIREGADDALYAIIRRTVNGRTVRYVERLHTRQFTALEDAFFVDSGGTYSGAPTTSVTGLWHLEGETVSILADGAVAASAVVANGAVTIADAASVIHVGLPITADLQTLPLAIETPSAAGQGTLKNVNEIWLRVVGSSLIFVGPSFDKLREYPQRTSESYGSPPALKTDEIHLVIDPKWRLSAELCVRQTAPLPITIASFTLGVAPGG